MDPAQSLKDLKPSKDFFIGIDSDGCVFDTMGIKQRECFCPMLIGYFGLQPVAQAARECKDFADLFSKTRGANRHKTAVRIIRDLLPTHPMVKERGFKVPVFEHYFNWVDNPQSLLSNEGLKQAIDEATDNKEKTELQQVLKWSLRVNEMVTEIVKDIPPFPYVQECLEKITKQADVIVCSATPNEALIREWQEHNIAQFPKVIAGQEMGKKAQHLDYASTGKYTKNHVLMIGDAPGDLKAARSVGALFFPVNPGAEAASWKRFHDEAFDTFINGQYAGDYEAALISEFDDYLPENPPWKI
ncbi:MAG: HAD hydrolase-like protein [Sedimentisphaerales bacterium]|nr:HAD hydrolase-like protein [Sedimentisphaerales bacterium]